LIDAVAPSSNASRAKPAPKRRNDATAGEDRPAKRTRRGVTVTRSERTVDSQSSISTQEQEPTSDRHLPSPRSRRPISEDHGHISNLQEETGVSSESDQSSEHRGNQQQPTPPAEIPSPQKIASPVKGRNASMRDDGIPSPTLEEMEKKRRDERRISNFIRINRRAREEEEEEKALSDCEDDEWARRFPLALLSYGNRSNPSRKPSSSHVHWIPGSKAMFVVRGNQDEEDDATVSCFISHFMSLC